MASPHREHLYQTYAPPALTFAKGEGAVLTTTDGARYLDFISGIAVNALGHAHPKAVAALKQQADTLWHLSNMFDVPGQAELAAKYCAATFAERVFFTNSGAEAVECALKTARKYHAAKGQPDRITILTFTGAFHGRTYGAMNAGGNPAYLEGFGPAMPGFRQLPFGDHGALEQAMDNSVAAVLIEPVQGEGGVRAVPPSCLQGLRQLCDTHGALLIYDEVQSGAGRTGQLFAYQAVENAAPDIMAVAKGVGGGFPLGACLATAAASEAMVVGAHGSTFGGNALAMAVGHAVWDVLTEPGFLEHVQAVSAHLRRGLEALAAGRNSAVITDIRGAGLLLGMKVAPPNRLVRDAARDRGLLVGVAGDNVVRLAPPLIITFEEADEALAALDGALAEAAQAGEAAS